VPDFFDTSDLCSISGICCSSRFDICNSAHNNNSDTELCQSLASHAITRCCRCCHCSSHCLPLLWLLLLLLLLLL